MDVGQILPIPESLADYGLMHRRERERERERETEKDRDRQRRPAKSLKHVCPATRLLDFTSTGEAFILSLLETR